MPWHFWLAGQWACGVSPNDVRSIEILYNDKFTRDIVQQNSQNLPFYVFGTSFDLCRNRSRRIRYPKQVVVHVPRHIQGHSPVAIGSLSFELEDILQD